MTNSKPLKHSVEVIDYDPRWAEIFSAERDILLRKTGNYLLALEHIGSTAIPGQRAKPIIDMMGAVAHLDDLKSFLPDIAEMGYQLFETGMRNRHFLRREDAQSGQTYHLHIVELSSWAERKERLLRDYLLAHPEAVAAYSQLKDDLARQYAEDSVAYTRAKTDFIQGIIDTVRDTLGLPRTNVWED